MFTKLKSSKNTSAESFFCSIAHFTGKKTKAGRGRLDSGSWVSYRRSQTRTRSPMSSLGPSPCLPAPPWTLAKPKLRKTVDTAGTVHGEGNHPGLCGAPAAGGSSSLRMQLPPRGVGVTGPRNSPPRVGACDLLG